MQENVIRICKKPGVKACVRINSEEDIPEFLKEVVKVDGDYLLLDSLEGMERVSLGSVIAYEQLKDGKMNVWNKANWKETTVEKDGVFYNLPIICEAVPLNKDIPSSIMNELNGRLVINGDMCSLDAKDGVQTCKIDEGYLVIHSRNEDGSIDASILAKETPSFEEYYIVNENNEFAETLKEYDESLDESLVLDNIE